ncbi:MAG: methyltransferase [Brasilonema sp.]
MLTTETRNQTNQVPQPKTLLQMIMGVCVSKSIYVAAKLGIADLLKDGAKSSDELATLTDVDAKSLYRVLRALSSIGIFAEDENQQFQITPLAEYLQTDVPGSMRAFVITGGEQWHLQTWGNILHSVKTGKSAFENTHGMEFSHYLAQHLEIAQLFNESMINFTSSCIPAVLDSYDFSLISKIVDVGGGHGLLIAEILKANPTMKGILFEQPRVVEGARHFIKAQGIAERCEIVGGNFFESVPSGGDAYMMKHIIHNWDAKDALSILKNCHQTMADNGKLLLLEKVIPAANQPSYSKWFDLQMLLMIGGRERTEIEYRELLAEAGFMLTKVVYTQSPIDIIEAVKV